MRLVSLDNCEAGARLGKTIQHDSGRILLAAGTVLTDNLKKRLKQLNIYSVYIEDEVSEGIEIVETIPVELRIEAMNTITEGLDLISEMEKGTSHYPSMMKTSRVVRSMQKVFKDIVKCLTENRVALDLLATTKVYEDHVYNHSLNVAIYACQLAIENGLPIKQIEEIGLGAMFHDIGKISIPKEILNKPGKLTVEEYETIKTHCEAGFNILKKVHEIPLPVSHMAFQHHERMDGLGYPRRLKGEEIHKYAKILSVADVFDAVTSHRPYRPAMLPHKGMEVIYSGNGTQFDSKQVDLFKGCIAIYPAGLTVKLNDGRTGIVTKYNFNSVGRPQVRIIQDEDGQATKPYEIDLSNKKHLTVDIVEVDSIS